MAVDKHFRPSGEEAPEPVNVQVIAAEEIKTRRKRKIRGRDFDPNLDTLSAGCGCCFPSDFFSNQTEYRKPDSEISK